MDKSTENLFDLIEGCEKFEGREIGTWAIEYTTWASKIKSLLSMCHQDDVCAIIGGLQRPRASSSTDGATTPTNSTSVRHDDEADNSSSVMTLQRWERASELLHLVLFFSTAGLPGLIIANFDGGGSDKRDGQAAWQALKKKYASRRAVTRVLMYTRMSIGQDPDEYIDNTLRLRKYLEEEYGKSRADDDYLGMTLLCGITSEYKDVELKWIHDQEFGIDDIRAAMRRIYLTISSRGRGELPDVGKSRGGCSYCKRPGHVKKNCRILMKRNKNRQQPLGARGGDGGDGGGGSVGGMRKWCSRHSSTTHSDAECRAQQQRHHQQQHAQVGHCGIAVCRLDPRVDGYHCER